MRYIILLLPIIFLSCLRIDSAIFEDSDSKIDGYYFDHYRGYVEFAGDSAHWIPENKINLFKIPSDNNGDIANIYVTYIGDVEEIAQDTVILFCHGNSMHMDYYWPRTRLLAHIGSFNRYGVVAFDYRGFGLSEGKSSEETLYADTYSVIEWLKNKGLTGDRLIVYGFSLGTAPAVKVTAEPKSLVPEKLILEAPFASADVFVKDASVLALPGSYITNLKISNGDEIRKIDQPLMWLHGTNDEIINIDTHGEVVFKNHNGRYKEAHRVEGSDHQWVPKFMGYDKYMETFCKFIIRRK